MTYFRRRQLPAPEFTLARLLHARLLRAGAALGLAAVLAACATPPDHMMRAAAVAEADTPWPELSPLAPVLARTSALDPAKDPTASETARADALRARADALRATGG